MAVRVARLGLMLALCLGATACTWPWNSTQPTDSRGLSAALDCGIEDWSLRGETAGARGERSGVVESHIARCQPEDPAAARTAFLAGHSEARDYFCSTAGQYVHARDGGRWRGGCDEADTEQLRAAFNAGHEVHLHREALSASARRLADIEQYLRVGQLQPRDQERFGDIPRAERDGYVEARRALLKRDARYAERYGAPELAVGAR